MKGEGKRGCSRRERLEVTAAALTAAALGLLGPMIQAGGRLGWLGPVVAAPVGLLLCALWERLGKGELSQGLEEALGVFGGRAAEILYLLWGLVLLTHGAWRYSQRLLAVYEGETVRWLFLGAALALALWLGRGNGAVFARTGRLFFLAVTVMLGFVLVLTLPGVDWRNLWPPEGNDWKGLPASGALALSLAGYGIYALCLPRREEEGVRAWPWTLWGCGIFGAALFVVTGSFGPVLAGKMEEPFLYLLEGVQVPGAFQRGEAGLVAVLTLADLALLTLLSRGCEVLWRRVMPWWTWGGAVAVAGAFAAAGMGWGEMKAFLLPGNLAAGFLVPVFVVLIGRARKKEPIFSAGKDQEKADIAEKSEDKKSS